MGEHKERIIHVDRRELLSGGIGRGKDRPVGRVFAGAIQIRVELRNDVRVLRGDGWAAKKGNEGKEGGSVFHEDQNGCEKMQRTQKESGAFLAVLAFFGGHAGAGVEGDEADPGEAPEATTAHRPPALGGIGQCLARRKPDFGGGVKSALTLFFDHSSREPS